MMRFLVPLGLFIVLVVFLAIGLKHDPHEIPSPLVGKLAPQFQLTQLASPEGKTFSPKDMLGKVWLLNVWASWCESCRDEQATMVSLANTGAVPIVGMDYKDQRVDAMKWLKQFGDPYVLIVFDADGRVGIDYGVYGVPETYVIDKAGVIRYKQIGPVTPEALEQKILPLVKELQK
jgi:cytochrome c biogenesis protein CcmG/thiol:disulfide interchange protein DsbE